MEIFVAYDKYFSPGLSVRLVHTTSESAPSYHIEISDSICFGDTYIWNNSTYTTSGDYTKQLRSIYGTDSIVTLHLSVISCPEVELKGAFSVSPTTKVAFSPGNLQYQASTDTWRFAEHQYDYVGDASKGNVYANGVKCDNAKISSSYNGWIDLFGWGTSGYNDKYPYMTSRNDSDYGDGEKDIAGTNYDWGVYNQIGSDPKGTWRTLTWNEWWYLYVDRPNANRLWGHGTVNGVPGTIILPDDWVLPNGLSFTAGTEGMPFDDNEYAYIGYGDHFGDNTYTLAQWAKMEAAGACFLPAAGFREGGTTIYEILSAGVYWSSTKYQYADAYADFFYFQTDQLFPWRSIMRYYGFSVRAVLVE